jgi:hypothetical protein
MWGQVNRCLTFGMQVASCNWEEALKIDTKGSDCYQQGFDLILSIRVV